MRKRLLIVDHHIFITQALKTALKAEGFEAEIAARGHDALLKVEQDSWDAILLDILLPDMNGLDVLCKMRSIRPSAKILILTGECDKRYGPRAFKAGCKGFLRKDRPYEEALEAIKKVAEGGTYITDKMAEHLIESLAGNNNQGTNSYETLSNREYEVVLKLAEGKLVKEISAELSIARQTVSTHRRKALDKLGLNTDAELVRFAVSNDLIPA